MFSKHLLHVCSFRGAAVGHQGSKNMSPGQFERPFLAGEISGHGGKLRRSGSARHCLVVVSRQCPMEKKKGLRFHVTPCICGGESGIRTPDLRIMILPQRIIQNTHAQTRITESMRNDDTVVSLYFGLCLFFAPQCPASVPRPLPRHHPKSYPGR